MKNASCGIAIFVKTPGYSSVKTRLAATIGETGKTRQTGKAAAEEFYGLAVKATGAVVQSACSSDVSIEPYWAVAEGEEAANRNWTGFNVLEQGHGGLGDRLDFVYSTLLSRHKAAILIGADSPFLRPRCLLDAARVAESSRIGILQPAHDGGFVLFACSKPLPKALWSAVRYSEPTTCADLAQQLQAYGGISVEYQEPERDIDVFDDLVHAWTVNHSRPDLLPEQKDLLRWIKTQLDSAS